MPRYFIDTDDGDVHAHDDEGHELSEAEAARQMALKSLYEMADSVTRSGDRHTFTASVRDESGATIYVATLELRGEWVAKPEA